MQKPTLVCLFAHPDDESFGPSGTIHLLTQTHDVYIICATNGDAGENHHPDGDHIDLATQRQKELTESSMVLGVKQVFFLHHKDGALCNNNYHAIAAECQTIIDDLRPDTLLTYEHHGISGHLDHIAMSMITSFLFERLSYVHTCMYYCLRHDQTTRKPGEYFVYFPAGYDEEHIDKVVDVSSVLDVKKEAIQKHVSQTKDMGFILKNLKKEECFQIRKKA